MWNPMESTGFVGIFTSLSIQDRVPWQEKSAKKLKAGNRNAKVLPLPVAAMPITSCIAGEDMRGQWTTRKRTLHFEPGLENAGLENSTFIDFVPALRFQGCVNGPSPALPAAM
jgi:hypothetical protein